METNLIIKGQAVHTENQLLKIIERFTDYAKKEGITLSSTNFKKFTILNYGRSKFNAISRRFASSPGKSDGWTQAKQKLGLPTKKYWTLNEIIEIYYKAYCQLNREPTVKEVELMGIPSSTVLNFFKNEKYGIPDEANHGGHYKAMYLMYKNKGINVPIKMPEYNINRPKYRGDNLAYFGLDTKKLGLEFSPVNEQGVVALFAKIHKAIGFSLITYITDYFPDAEGICNIGGKEHWVKIEFKYNLRKCYISPKDIKNKWHGTVQYLVCWEAENKKLLERLRPVKVLALKEILCNEDIIRKINEL